MKIIYAHFFLVDLKRTSEQQQSKQIVVERNVKLRNFCVSLGELQPRMVSFYRKLDSSQYVISGKIYVSFKYDIQILFEK